jgi:transposase
MKETTRNEIIRRWQAGMPMRKIARELGISRDRVSRVLKGQRRERGEEVASAEPSSTGAPRRSSLDDHQAFLESLLARYPGITAVRVHEELRKKGFHGGYTIVRDRLRKLRPGKSRSPVVRFETAPGAQSQVDYAVYELDFSEEGRRRVNLFSLVLGYSRRQYLCFVPSQDMATTLREHVRAFEHLGGVAATCLYDNMKVVVARWDDGEPIYNTRFLAFATHYGFRPWACRPRRPQTKGKVERPFQFVETNLLNAREFRSLAHLNEFTAQWLAETADVRTHRETGRRPIDLHAEEMPFLIPLPARPYDTAEMLYRVVDAEGFVSYRQNGYSAPWRLIGKLLPVRVTGQEILIYGPDLREVARHPLFPAEVVGQRREEAGHRPGEDRRRKEDWIRERFAELGTPATRFLEGLLTAKRFGWDQAQRVLALLGIYSQADVLAALERAARYAAFSLATVERILAAQARPKPALESWSDEERQRLRDTLTGPTIPPRSTSEYQSLLFDEQRTDEPPIQDQENGQANPEDTRPAEPDPNGDDADDPEADGAGALA